ncbi:MAG: STAS domain-containing protein [Eubacteriales bacterium]|nr:STAS domain-containing protein [Eubacteriales bacterium]
MLKKIAYDQEAGVWNAELTGDMDVVEAPRVIANLERALNEHPGGIIVECKELNYVDSMGLGAFVRLRKNIEQKGGSLKLNNLQPRIARLFEITGLSESFGIGGGAQ